MKLIDLSVTIQPEAGIFELQQPVIEYEDHQAGAALMKEMFDLGPECLRGGLGPAGEKVTLSTHCGTHFDAPWHFGPTSEGRKAQTIDEIPLEWCYGDGVVLDMRHKGDGEGIGVADLPQALEKVGYRLRGGEIVLILTGADRHRGTEGFAHRGCGMTREATLWLIEQGIRVMGTDAWGFDRPFKTMVEELRRTGDSSRLWEANYAGIDREYCHM